MQEYLNETLGNYNASDLLALFALINFKRIKTFKIINNYFKDNGITDPMATASRMN